ncbi:MAG: 3-methyl-2-oxobutanoate hydroxymethyltransferase [Phycisphaerales bacterium]
MSLSPPNNGSRPHQAGSPMVEPARAPITLRTLNRMAERAEPFACLACYDATTARWLERGGVHLLLAGDSSAQVVLGLERTIEAPLDFLVQITAAVKRGAPNTVVMADMPFLSYHTSDAAALRNAGRFMTEGRADCVKLEADGSFARLVGKMTRAGIPVCAHIGFRPQTTGLLGVPTAQGRTDDEAERIVEDAVALERAGAVMLLIEAVPPEVTRRVLARTRVPVIGIGAGQDCHGQILVVNDLVGLTDAPPRFAEPVAAVGQQLLAAGRAWVERVGKRDIGGSTYSMRAPPAGGDSARATPTPEESQR